MRSRYERRAVSDIVGVLLMLAIVVALGVLIFSLSNGWISSFSQNYATAMSNQNSATSEKFVVEQVAIAYKALAIDGSATATAVASSVPASLTTASANDIIYAVVQVDSGTIQLPTATGLAFTLRASATMGSAGTLATYYAVASVTLSALSITAHATGNGDITLIVFGISGADTVSPFDSNTGVPATATGTGSTSTVNISTNNANDLIIGAVGNDDGTNPTQGTGYNLILSNNNNDAPISTGSESKVVSAAQTSLAAGFTASGPSNWEMIADAVAAAPAGVDVYVRNAGSIPTALVSVYIADLTTGAFVSQTTISIAVNVGTFAEVPHTSFAFVASHGHTYSITVTSSLGNSAIYNAKVA